MVGTGGSLDAEFGVWAIGGVPSRTIRGRSTQRTFPSCASAFCSFTCPGASVTLGASSSTIRVVLASY